MRLPEQSPSHPIERTESRSVIEDQRPGQTVLMNDTERRRSPRTSIRRLAYVNLEPYDNGGVITDISSDGLRFHMVKPVDQGGVVRLSILLGAANHVDAVGELVWLDASRKVGGVRFTVLPAGAADQILNWAKALNTVDAATSARRSGAHGGPIPNQASTHPSQAKPDMTPNVTRDNVAASPTLKTASAQVTEPQAVPETNGRPAWVPPSVRPTVRPETTAPSSQNLPGPAGERKQPWVRPDDSQQPDAMPWITHFDPDPPARGGSFLRGVLGGFLICALLGSAAWFGFRHYVSPNGLNPFGNWLAQNPVVSSPVVPHDAPAASDLRPDASTANPLPAEQGQLAAPQPTSPSIVPSVQPDPNMQARSDAVSPTPLAPKVAPAPQTSTSAQTPSPQAPIAQLAPPTTPGTDRTSPAVASQQNTKTNATQSSVPPDAGESQLMLARQYLDGRVQPRNPMVASQLLWSAVEKGNSTAEMDLADLYLHGDGVARNCDQARVLLSVASEKGNPEATQKLHELNRTGCR
jgi:hypothetical protein